MHVKKQKGDLGIVNAILALTEQEWNVSLPISEHQKYDLIAEKDGTCKRVQVRYTTPTNGKMSIKLRSIWSDSNGVHFAKRKKGDFDVLAAYNPQSKKVYFIDDSKFDNETALTLRIEPSKNGQVKGVRLAEDFLVLNA